MKNFRGIKEGKIEGLGQVNILIGKNNSGKSTVLDFLCFFKASLVPKNAFGEQVLESLLQRRVKRQVLDDTEFFHNYLPENEVAFEAIFEDNFKAHFKAKKLTNGIFYSYVVPTSDEPVATMLIRFQEPYYVEVGSHRGNITEPLEFIIDTYKRSSPNMSPVVTSAVLSANAQKNLAFLSNVVLIDSDFVRKIEKIEDVYWAHILKRRKDKILREILNQTYGLQIESFSFANYKDRQSKIFVMLPEISMHIDDYGDGFRYAFSILTVASQIKNTALLLEEPEVHQHEGALRQLFEALLQIAEKNKLQLFITTHSLDVIKIWTQLIKDVKIFHLTRSAEGKLDIRHIEGTDAKLMMDLGVSPLSLSEDFSYLVVEGKEDKIFLESIAEKIKEKSLDKLGYEILCCPQSEQKTTVAALASTGKQITVCRDFDGEKSVSELVNPFKNSLNNKFKDVEASGDEIKVKETGSKITVIPMGLPKDKELIELGIAQFAMEDFLISLLSKDEKLKGWKKIDLQDLRKRVQSFKDKVNLKSSKALLMQLGSIMDGKTIDELIPEIIKNCDPKMLADVSKPVVEKLLS